MELLIKFEFENGEFDVTEQTIDKFYLKIWREVRTEPLPGMRPLVPFGGLLGLQPVLLFKVDKKPLECEYRLFRDDVLLQRDFTTANGESGYLLLPLGVPGRYRIEFYGREDGCNRRNEELIQWISMLGPLGNT